MVPRLENKHPYFNNMNKSLLFLLFTFGIANFVKAQDSLHMNKLGHLDYAPAVLNDVWGYADSVGNEYALVGGRNMFSVVDVTDPSVPTEVFNIPGANSVWRDVKTYSHYAYVVHDSYSGTTSDGIRIVDLNDMDGTPTFYSFFPLIPSADSSTYFLYTRSHNIYIDENGILYVFGSDVMNGGALMFDLTQDPESPQYLGTWDNFYLHDGMVRGDTLWGGAVLNGRLYVIDVSDKSNPVTMGSTITPSVFTHNAWVSDDNSTVFTTDEVPDGYVAAYDVTDLSNISELDVIQSSYGTNVIPHNVHVFGDHLVTSYYTSGVQIVDSEYPDNLVEVAYYDHSSFNDNTYNGSWGVYPYLPSGNIISTDILEGLFVLQTDYPKASRFKVEVIDSVTGNPIPAANMTFKASQVLATTNISGVAKVGSVDFTNDTLTVGHTGYLPYSKHVVWQSGSYPTMVVKLVPENIGISEWKGITPSIFPNPSSGDFTVEYSGDMTISYQVVNSLGQVLVSRDEFFERDQFTLNTPGVYVLLIKSETGSVITQKIIVQ